MMQPTMLTVVASEIVSGGVTMTKTNGAYNIDPASISGKVGFREYSKFNLTEGDIANLIYKYGADNIETFVNLMQDNAFNINGIVNSMRDGNFYNGKAVFISPKGVVVGASGVINVGSLGLYQPDTDIYKNLKDSKTAENFAVFESNAKNGDMQYTGTYGNNEIIKIDGKVYSQGDVAIVGPRVEVSENAGVFAGLNGNAIAEYEGRAQELFNELVNTNLAIGNKFETNNNGQITIISTGNGDYRHNNAGTVIDGTIRNFSNGNEAGTTIKNFEGSSNGINISSTANIVNTNGEVLIHNQEGNLVISGNVKNNGNSTGIINSKSKFTIGDIPNPDSELNINGNVKTNGNLSVINTGNKGLNISGNINHTGDNAYFQNGDTAPGYILRYDTTGMTITGNINTTGNAEFFNTANGSQGMNISGVIDAGGKAKFTNDGKGGLNVTANATNTNNIIANGLEMKNTGENGLNINGKVKNTGTATVYNTEGGTKGLNIGGTFNNTGNATFTNEGNDGLNTSGTITATTLSMINESSGTKGLNIKSGANVTSNGDSEFKNYAGALHAQDGSTIKTTSGTATYYNEGNGGMLLEGTINNGKLNADGTVANTVTTIANNNLGEMRLGGNFTNFGASTFNNNEGASALNVTGNVTNYNDKLTITNNGSGSLTVASNGFIDAHNQIAMTNNGGEGFIVEGGIANIGNGEYINNVGKFEAKANSYMSNHGGTAHYYNKGNGGMLLKGVTENTGTTNAENIAGEMLIAGDFTNNGSSTFTNKGTALNVTGTINKDMTSTTGTSVKLDNTGAGGLNITSTGSVKASTIEMKNTGKSGLNVAGITTSTNDTTVTNSGADGFNTTGTIEAASGNINTTNTGAAGTNVKATGQIKSMFGDTTIKDISKGGVNIEGYVKGKDVNISSNGGNVTIGDNTSHTNPSYVFADKNVDITSTNGSILNYGVEKILIKAGGDLTMNAENGTIGLPVQQNACVGSGCTGIGPRTDGARDFTKSINAQVTGKVNAHTNATSEAAKQEDLVINYASIGEDMKVDTIKADGRVILTVDDDYGRTNNGKRYSIVNARPNDNTDTNIEGWGISLIADKNIGTADNKVTFIQNRAADGYKIDALANKDIYLKENSFNDSDYGRAKEVKNNEVCTMIAREGDMYVEFAGDTNIKNITAEGDLTVITRGKNLNIENLGHIKDSSVEPRDYFGPRDYGLNDNPRLPDGGNTGVYGKEPLPNNVVVKALDINHNIRPTEAEIEVPKAGEGLYEAYADSTVKITNAVVDKGHMDITADNIYANGIEAHFNKDGFSKKENNITNKTDGVFNALSDKNAENNIPNGHAVRPGDVSGIGRNKHERNYYYNKGNGNMTDPYIIVDDNKDNIADATPLALEKNKPTPPHIDDTPRPLDDDGRWMNIPKDEDEIDNIDKRQYMRFNVNGSEFPILLEKTNNGVTNLLDVSRGGVALAHDGSLKVGDIVPLHMMYADMDVHAQVKVVSATTSRAGAEFVNIDKGTANQLLYLNIVVDNWHNELSLK